MRKHRLSLSKAGFRNLKDICREFDRCSRSYPALYHQRMVPWSEKGRGGINLPQWEVFRQAAFAQLDDDVWSQWDEPSAEDDYLGLWSGDGEGLAEFVDLRESVAMVLSREDMDFDPFNWSCEIQRGSDWLPLLHDWAFKHQMPLLRSEMGLWGCDEYDLEDFYELAEMWDTLDDGTKIPRHPVVWRLVDNVFTSSMTAIRAMLWPDSVVTTYEPWPVMRGEFLDLPLAEDADNSLADSRDSSTSKVNSLVYDGLLWTICYLKEPKTDRFRGYEGFVRIAKLLQKPFHFFEYHELSLKPQTKNESGDSTTDRERDQHARHVGTHSNDKADWEWKQSISMRLKELSDLLQKAESSGKQTTIAELRREMQDVKRFRRQYLNKYGKSRKDSDEWDQDRKTVTKSLTETIKRISEKLPILGAYLQDHIRIDRGVIYEPPDSNEKWEVVIARRGH